MVARGAKASERDGGGGQEKIEEGGRGIEGAPVVEEGVARKKGRKVCRALAGEAFISYYISGVDFRKKRTKRNEC